MTIDVEIEVSIRKYEVNKEKLIECLRDHKILSNKEIAKKLNRPLTLVEHWFRQDNYFAIPDADVWLELKEMLGITTTEFDKSIMTFETQGGNYDMRNRIYSGEVSATLMRGSEKNLYLLPEKKTYRKSSHPQTSDQGQGWEETEVNDTLNIYDTGEIRTPTLVLENHPADSRVKVCEDGIFQTLSGRMGTGGGNVPMVLENKEPILLESNQNHATIQTDGVSTTLPASMGMGGGYVPMVTDDKEYIKSVDTSHADDAARVDDVVPCMQGRQSQGGNNVQANSIVRRLTPKECERLQNYPDDWTNIGDWVDSKGKKHKDADSPRYKALGNSIALPFWEWMAGRICTQYDRQVTMGSLFDGISGFCLVFARCGAIPVFSSEIEEFPIAVAKKHFGDDDKGEKGDYEQYL